MSLNSRVSLITAAVAGHLCSMFMLVVKLGFEFEGIICSWDWALTYQL